MNPGRLVILIVGVALAATSAGCARAGGAAGVPDEDAVRAQARAAADTVDELRRTGDFAAFSAEAVALADRFPEDARLRALAAEGLLAAGNTRAAEIDALEAERLAGPAAEGISAAAIRLWATARLRQGLPLETAQLARIVLDDPALETVLAWSDLLAGAAPCQVEPPSTAVAASLSDAEPDSLAAELLAIDGEVNGVRLTRLFIDTGAQHTVMTRAAAQAAGVRTQASEIELTGFATATAEAGVVDRLALGPLTIRNVPVLVGDTPALTAAQGSMSLGSDLLFHLRVTLDYPERRVTIAPATAGADATAEPVPGAWRIPVWTFSRLPLAQGNSPGGSPLRVLVDTGDRQGTYISYRWGRREIPQLAGVHSGLVFRFKKKDLTLPPVELGGRVIADWPVVDTLPKELDRLDVVDLMLGHDLLRRFRVTVDLSRRELWLSSTDSQALQVPIRPTAAKGEHDLP